MTQPATPPLFFFAPMSPHACRGADRNAPARRRVAAGLRRRALQGKRPDLLGTHGSARGRHFGLEARARAHGLGEIRWLEPWPTLDVLVSRAMLFAQGRQRLQPFALEAMRLAFLEGCDLAELAVVRVAARRADLDPVEVADATQEPRMKAALRHATDDAVARGVFGVPTTAVGAELFWGMTVSRTPRERRPRPRACDSGVGERAVARVDYRSGPSPPTIAVAS